MLIAMGMMGVYAQETEDTMPLQASQVKFVTRLDPFGAETLFMDGILKNNDTSAYNDIVIFAELYDDDDTIIGEGFGYLVDACGNGLTGDFALQPNASKPFALSVEFYEDNAQADDIERYQVFPEANALNVTNAAADSPMIELPELPYITRVTDREVVSIEWETADSLRYGVGCDGDVFTMYQWYQYTLARGVSFPIMHPNAGLVTPALRETLGLTDPILYNRSYLNFHPNSNRLIYQNDLNSILTTERDGTFKRLLYDDLARVSLHGFGWLPEGRFIAYYFGAFGDPVRYFTASVAGQRISGTVYNVVPSQIVPGATPDGVRVVMGGTLDGVTGYFLTSAMSNIAELLFEGEVPGNNYPAPIYVPQTGGTAHIYIVRPVEGAPLLQCFNRDTDELSTLTALPIRLTDADRAWTWLSPDRARLGLAANGLNGGLWLIDLAAIAAERDGAVC